MSEPSASEPEAVPRPAALASGQTTIQPSEVTTGFTIGDYRLLELLGQGGMGEVWLAEQRRPVRRRVALKLIKLGMDTHEVIARFEAERQALALMDHPGIAKVFDAGATLHGRPYFVMEYMPGLPITAFCDKRQLTTNERLRLISQVCAAVQHAHQKAVIHRDLKPTNILVSEVNGLPAAKIIDFGVAKAIGERLTAETMFTRIGSVIGTPEYMSPEQADTAVQDVDTRTDVYSLGVILYEVLVGAPPLDYRKLAFDEVLRRIREEDAPRPSTRFRTLGEQSAIIAKNRRTEPRTLSRQLRGDLDSIALKCIEKDRARRYGTPAELAADLERYLRNETVTARPASIRYRVKKYVSRHRFGTSAALLFVTLLAAFAATEALQLRRIHRELDRSDRVSEFMTDMFLVSRPFAATRGTNIPASEILDKANKDIDVELKNDPQLQARLLQNLGTIYYNLGFLSRAESLLRRAIDIQNRVLARGDRETFRSETALARVLLAGSETKDAEKILRATLASQQQSLGRDNPDTAVTMQTFAEVLAAEHNLVEAEKVSRLTLAIRQQNRPAEDRHVWSSEWQLFRLLLWQNKKAEAEKVGLGLIDDSARLLGRDSPESLSSMRLVAELFIRDGKYPEAESVGRQAADVERSLPPDLDLFHFSGSELFLSSLIQEAKLTEAKEFGEDLLARERRMFGSASPKTAYVLYFLGCVAARSGKPDEALSWLKQSLDKSPRRDLFENMKHDSDLQSLWKDPRFLALQARGHQPTVKQITRGR